MNWTEKELRLFELTGSEIKILESLETAKSVQDIAKGTKISRTAVNFSIKKLLRKKLMRVVHLGKRKLYVAVTEKELRAFFEQAIAAIDIVDRDKAGVKLRLSKENEFHIHVGTEDILFTYQRIASMNKNERIKAIQHHKAFNELLRVMDPLELKEFNRSITENGLIVDGLLDVNAYESYRKEMGKDASKKDAAKTFEGRMADYSAFPANFFDLPVEIWIFKSTTLMINWREDVAVEIINENMTKFFRDMFEFVKAGSKKIDHNLVMREILEK